MTRTAATYCRSSVAYTITNRDARNGPHLENGVIGNR